MNNVRSSPSKLAALRMLRAWSAIEDAHAVGESVVPTMTKEHGGGVLCCYIYDPYQMGKPTEHCAFVVGDKMIWDMPVSPIAPEPDEPQIRFCLKCERLPHKKGHVYCEACL